MSKPDLSEAVGESDLAKIRALLDTGADVRYVRPHGYTVMIDVMHGLSIADDPQLIPTAAGALAFFDQASAAAEATAYLVRVTDPGTGDRFLDVAVCEWGWALLWNDYTRGTGDSFGTWAGGASEPRSFAQPGGDDLAFDRQWFIPGAEGRRAVAVYLRTRKLWRGVRWWPDPPAELLAE